MTDFEMTPFHVDDLTLDEVREFDQLVGYPFRLFGRAMLGDGDGLDFHEAVAGFYYLVRKRSDPDWTWDATAKLSIRELTRVLRVVDNEDGDDTAPLVDETS